MAFYSLEGDIFVLVERWELEVHLEQHGVAGPRQWHLPYDTAGVAGLRPDSSTRLQKCTFYANGWRSYLRIGTAYSVAETQRNTRRGQIKEPIFT